MAGIDKIDSLIPAYASSGVERDEVMKLISGISGKDAVLKILHMKDRVQREVMDRRLYVLMAMTGAGKSTHLMVALWEEFVATRRERCTLLCTQPRINLAMTTAASVSSMYPHLHLGDQIGYQTGSKRVLPTAPQNMLYCTTQELTIFITTMDPQSFGRAYPVVAIDEAHDQSTEMLILLMHIRDYMTSYFDMRWCPRFIVTSATIDPVEFMDYFGVDVSSPYNAALVEVPSRFPIKEFYLPDDFSVSTSTSSSAAGPEAEEGKEAEDGEKGEDGKGGKKGKGKGKGKTDKYSLIQQAVIDSIETLPTDVMPSHSDIAIVMASVAEITKVVEMLKQLPSAKWKPWKLNPIPYTRADPMLLTERFITVIRERKEWELRIIVSTNLIEVGVNFPYLHTIIDSGRHIMVIPCPLQRSTMISSFPISTFEQIQRRGRVGRTGPGTVRYIYTKGAANAFERSPYPSTITNASISMAIYRTLAALLMEKYRHAHSMTGEIDERLSLLEDVGAHLFLASKRSGYRLPSVDILNDLRLLSPISVDAAIRAVDILTSAGLLSPDGSLGYVGLQFVAIGANSVDEGYLTAYLMSQMFHPMEIRIASSVLSKALQSAEKGQIEWKDSVMRFFPTIDFAKRDNQARIDHVMVIYEEAMRLVRKMAKPKWNPETKFTGKADQKGKSPLYKELNYEAVFALVTERLAQPLFDLSVGSIFADPGAKERVPLLKEFLFSLIRRKPAKGAEKDSGVGLDKVLIS